MCSLVSKERACRSAVAAAFALLAFALTASTAGDAHADPTSASIPEAQTGRLSLSLKEALDRAEQRGPEVLLAGRAVLEARAQRVGAGVVLPENPRLSVDARPLFTGGTTGQFGYTATWVDRAGNVAVSVLTVTVGEGQGLLARTDASGSAHFKLAGADGSRFDLTVTCPAAYGGGTRPDCGHDHQTQSVTCVSVLFVAAAAMALGFSFKNVLANFACLVIAYGAYCFLAVSCWRIRFWPLRFLRSSALQSRSLRDTFCVLSACSA